MTPKKVRTETGPRYESHNPGEGCNSTHVARSRKKWKRRAARSERRTGKVTPKFFFGNPKKHTRSEENEGRHDDFGVGGS